MRHSAKRRYSFRKNSQISIMTKCSFEKQKVSSVSATIECESHNNYEEKVRRVTFVIDVKFKRKNRVDSWQ